METLCASLALCEGNPSYKRPVMLSFGVLFLILWNVNQKSYIFIQENAFEDVVCGMAKIYTICKPKMKINQYQMYQISVCLSWYNLCSVKYFCACQIGSIHDCVLLDIIVDKSISHLWFLGNINWWYTNELMVFSCKASHHFMVPIGRLCWMELASVQSL